MRNSKVQDDGDGKTSFRSSFSSAPSPGEYAEGGRGCIHTLPANHSDPTHLRKGRGRINI